MIEYYSGAFGFQLLLLRFDGSAVFKSFVPAVLSCGIYVLLYNVMPDVNDSSDPDYYPILFHPYPMGALIAALTFLLTFRANFSYNRYWEAMTAVHTMHSRWIDVATEAAAFHLQSQVYDTIKPPAFGSYPHVTELKQRQRKNEPTFAELENLIDEIEQKQREQDAAAAATALQEQNKKQPSFRKAISTSLRFRKNATKKTSGGTSKDPKENSSEPEADNTGSGAGDTTKHNSLISVDDVSKPSPSIHSINAVPENNKKSIKRKTSLLHRISFGGDDDDSEDEKLEARHKVPPQCIISPTVTKKVWKHDHTPLYLQELAHLLSLLSAVALSELRNDVAGAESPLAVFTPGAPWPHVDPDSYSADVRKGWSGTKNRYWELIKYSLNVSRTIEARTLYNAARPFRVIGGVSDNEIQFLQAAHNPSAKVALVMMWVAEFITRESRYGSTGIIAPPILTRLYQWLSDGMVQYNQARKIAYLPFPFPHAQITALFTLVVTGFLPVLMLQYCTNIYFGFTLNFVTVMCFTGLQEVARELESPFLNVPNDIPLNNFQAQYNESLLVMFAGYHPDFYSWDPNRVDDDTNDPPPVVDETTKMKDEKATTTS